MTADREIQNLVFRYAQLIDAGDFEGVGDLFAAATITIEDGTPLATGRAEVQALYEATTRRYDDGTPRTRHVTTNLVLDIDDENGTAIARSYFTVFQATDTIALQPIIAGTYRDGFERIDGRWRFSSRAMNPTLLGDLSQHLLFDATTLEGTDD